MKETCLNCKQNKAGELARLQWNDHSEQVKMKMFFKILFLTAKVLSISKLSVDFNKSGNKVENFWYSTGD